ncbi:MAG: biopolymer transporter ExbD [Bacteroidaceae bacterium]|nr:biopolymer transporter ExbD [Bacteroidaceae bacterium]MBQ6693713.1 biopolymer transporter ExbD [Bacteroidaceae bacterium]MBR7167104.1 biopolymer transporter ExbD [Bacteroidaceae bacterium]
MSKFQNKGKAEMPELNTSSLPDLIFSILFFFMIVTSMREVELKVEFKTPAGTELEKLERKSLVSNIYIGKPTREFRAKLGTQSRIQLNDKFADVSHIREYIQDERASLAERDKPFMKVSIKGDKDTQMGIITDVKMELRKAWALSIVYSAAQR